MATVVLHIAGIPEENFAGDSFHVEATTAGRHQRLFGKMVQFTSMQGSLCFILQMFNQLIIVCRYIRNGLKGNFV